MVRKLNKQDQEAVDFFKRNLQPRKFANTDFPGLVPIFRERVETTGDLPLRACHGDTHMVVSKGCYYIYNVEGDTKEWLAIESADLIGRSMDLAKIADGRTYVTT